MDRRPRGNPANGSLAAHVQDANRCPRLILDRQKADRRNRHHSMIAKSDKYVRRVRTEGRVKAGHFALTVRGPRSDMFDSQAVIGRTPGTEDRLKSSAVKSAREDFERIAAALAAPRGLAVLKEIAVSSIRYHCKAIVQSEAIAAAIVLHSINELERAGPGAAMREGAFMNPVLRRDILRPSSEHFATF